MPRYNQLHFCLILISVNRLCIILQKMTHRQKDIYCLDQLN